jgi:uncharacterized protein YcbX
VRLTELWRYPVKSMAGERLEAAAAEPDGLEGDRRFGVADLDTGHLLSAKREGRLLLAAACLVDGAPRITLPGGERLDGPGRATDRALSEWLGRPVALVEASDEVPTFVAQEDEDDDASRSVTWDGQPDRLVDSSPLHLLTTASLRAMARQRPDLSWHVARFRPNLVVEAGGDERAEDSWLGAACEVGPVRLAITKPCTRCVMVTRPQPAAGLDRQQEVLKHLSVTADATLGVLARVVEPGRLGAGDEVRVEVPAGG